MLSNPTRKLLYIGATKNLLKRLDLHEKGTASVFTKKYHVKYLVYYEGFDDVKDAFKREKQVKNWKKEWKWNLVKSKNSNLIKLKNSIT